MKHSRPTFLKRTLIVDRDLQLRIMLHTLYVVAISSCITFLLVRIDEGTTLFGIGGTYALALYLSLALAGAIGSALLLGHSIAGPIFHLEKNMSSILNGDAPTALNFRKTDHFQHVAVTYNQLITRIPRGTGVPAGSASPTQE